MTLDDFITKYNGRGIDYDGAYGFQCVDLWRQYVKEVLGFPQSKPIPGAKDVWDTYLPEYYERISNTPTGVPKVGDIMIWGSAYGPYGHIAVVTGANEKTFSCFSQNDPVGKLCGVKQYRSYKGVLGWLHPKYDTKLDTTQAELDMIRKERDDNWNLYQEVKIELEQAQATIKAYADVQQTLAQKLATDNQTTSIIGAVERFLVLEDQARSAVSKYEESIHDLEVAQKTIEAYGSTLFELQTRIEALMGIETQLKEANDELLLLRERKILDRHTTGELINELLKRITGRK
jgi:hypothetical protein